MYRITDQQVDFILDDIRRRGVEMEDLQYNLLDHICCIIEQNLEADGDFEGYYQQIITRFYKQQLSEIEEETIQLLTFKNYYGMKKLMMGSGVFSTIAFVVGSFFKIMHWPGASVILVLAFFAFCLIFLPLLFLLKTKESGSKRDSIILGTATLAGILYGVSMLFQVMHWPGARIIWLSTLMLTAFVLLPLYFFNGIRKPEAKTNTIVTSIILVGILGMQFTLTAMHRKPEPTAQVQASK